MDSIRHELVCHSDTPANSIESITVYVEWTAAGALWLRYHVEGPLDVLGLSDPAQPARADGLWQTTCFELFIRLCDDVAYCEFNFSSSSQWAAYRFESYRQGMAELAVADGPGIALDASETHFALEAVIGVPIAWRAGPLEVALSAVIEETDGTKSYWALRHPPGPPDFHHPDCFAVELAAPERT